MGVTVPTTRACLGPNPELAAGPQKAPLGEVCAAAAPKKTPIPSGEVGEAPLLQPDPQDSNVVCGEKK